MGPISHGVFFLEQRFLYFSNIHILVFGNMCITKVMVSQHIHKLFVPYIADAACNDTDIQLVGGRNDSELEGRVEVCLLGQWGTVCDYPWDNSWDTDNAIVVCRQLGLNSACKG